MARFRTARAFLAGFWEIGFEGRCRGGAQINLPANARAQPYHSLALPGVYREAKDHQVGRFAYS